MITLNNAESRVCQAKIDLQDAQTTYDREKRLYKKSLKRGDLLTENATSNMIKLNNAEARLEKVRLVLQDARTTYDREKDLYEKVYGE